MRVHDRSLRLLTLLLIVQIASACISASPRTPAPTASQAAIETLGPSATPSMSPALSPSIPPTATPSIAPTVAPTTPPSPACASQTLASLTEAQRIGQLFNVGLDHDQLSATTKATIVANHFGSVWYRAKTSIGVNGVRAVADAAQALATKVVTGRVGFFVAANQEGGLVQAMNGPGFDPIPSAVDQGKLRPADLQTLATTWGAQLKAAGINLDFAPVADTVPNGTESTNAPIGKLLRQYGSDPLVVAPHVVAFIHGMRAAGVATTAKHFPGLGRVEGNTDFTGGVVDDVTTADDADLKPFARAIAVHAPFVMVSLATYTRIDPDHLAAFSPAVIDGVLRHDLGYRGVVMSDSLTAHAVADIPLGTRAIDFLEAGGDMIVLGPIDMAVPMVQAISARVATDAAFRARVDQSVLRILTAKDAAGLLPCSG